METITKTLQIPQNHQITFALPNHIPIGPAEVVLVIHPQKRPKFPQMKPY